jgi:hypothetical protein
LKREETVISEIEIVGARGIEPGSFEGREFLQSGMIGVVESSNVAQFFGQATTAEKGSRRPAKMARNWTFREGIRVCY